MENPDEFLKSETLVWTLEETSGACISREADACYLDLDDKPWQVTIDGVSKGNTGLKSEVQKKMNNKVSGKESQ